MARILTISGSPSPTSRTAMVLSHVERQLVDAGHEVGRLAVRELTPEALFAADTSDPTIRAALHAVAEAAGVVVATPVYKAAYTGLLKTLLDLLPQHALAGKAALPLALGGSPAHMLAIDYALRPVLTSMGARHVVPGYFLVDRLLTPTDDGGILLDPGTQSALRNVVGDFGDALTPVPLARSTHAEPELAATG